MTLDKNTFKTGRQYKEDDITQYFGDAEISEGWRGNKKSLTVDCGQYRWVFEQNHSGKFVLVEGE